MLAPLTTHARVRMQQRGIPPVAVEVLLEYGREAHDHRGCRIVRFDKRSRRRAARALGEAFRRIEGASADPFGPKTELRNRTLPGGNNRLLQLPARDSLPRGLGRVSTHGRDAAV